MQDTFIYCGSSATEVLDYGYEIRREQMAGEMGKEQD